MSEGTEKNDSSSTAGSVDHMLRDEALEWYKMKYPFRKTEEGKIVEMYIKLKEYATSDPLLEEYYAANKLAI